METEKLKKVGEIYYSMLHELDNVLIGQKEVKRIISAAMLCDNNSHILLTGNTGMGKTTLTNYLASNFNKERISVTSDMIPSDIQGQLMSKPNMNFLQIDELNRASGKVQSTFIELLAEKQMSIDGKIITFNDFYVLATQNSADISGIFNVPQAVYDRFDINIYFEDLFKNLSDEEKRKLFFSNFEPAMKSNLNMEDITFTKNAVNQFEINRNDEKIILQAFDIINDMSLNEKKLFAGSNIRAHKFAIKLAKLSAMADGRTYILPTDIAEFIYYVYMHRIDQNVARMNDDNVLDVFEDTQNEILSLKRKWK